MHKKLLNLLTESHFEKPRNIEKSEGDKSSKETAVLTNIVRWLAMKHAIRDSILWNFVLTILQMFDGRGNGLALSWK